MRCFAQRSLESLLSISGLAPIGFGLLMIGPLTLYGQFDQIWINPGTGNWFTPGNWIAEGEIAPPPTATQSALVNEGTAQIGAADAVAGSLSVGIDILTDSGGAPFPAAAPVLGGSTVEILNGGFLTITGDETIGPNGNIIVDAGGGIQANGTITNNGNFEVSLGTFSGTFEGTGNVIKIGTGTVIWGVNLNNAAHLFVDDGTLVDSANSIGIVTVDGPASVLRVSTGITLTTVPTLMNGGTIDNFGKITAGVVSDTGPGNVINETGGQLTNLNGTAIFFTGGGTVTNNAGGVISGTAGSAVAITGGRSTLVNSGTINGSVTLGNPTAGPATFINSGVINGSVTLGNSVNTAQLFTGSKISGDLNLGSNAGSNLILDGPGVATVSQAVTGTITNAGSLTKQGSGTWTIDKALNAPVATNVIAGVLNVDGQLNSPVVNVQAGGTLKGTGVIGPIGGTVTNAGNLSPGHSPGTLTISGNYTQTSTGTYNVLIVSASEFSRLIVGGHATLDGTLRLTLASGFVPRVGSQFSILTATGGISGTFRTVIGPNGQVFQVIYKNGVVDVTSVSQRKVVPPQFHLSDGTPTSTTALIANSTFYDFGSLSGQMAQSGKNNSIGITFDAGEFTFEGQHGEVYGFPITGEFKISGRMKLQYQIPLQYVEISNTGLFQTGLTLELPTKVIVASPDQPWAWDVTPAAAFAASGSREIIGAGALTNVLAYHWPWLTLTYGNYISFFKGHTLSTDDTQFPTGVDQQMMKNGLKMDIPFGKGWIIECYGIYTQFFQSAPVSSYLTVGGELGHHFTWNVEGQNLDLGYLSFGLYTEQGNHYSSGHLRVGSAWRF